MLRLIRNGWMAAMALLASTGSALAEGKAVDWQLGFQDPASPVMVQIDDFHDLLLVIITLISVFVLALLVYVVIKFREDVNPTPSRRTHHALLEVIWTAVPVLILVLIAIPSFKTLYYMDKASDPEMTIKAVAYQWYWSYEYPDLENITFDAYMLEDDELEEGQPRLLTTDETLVVPVNTDIRLLITAGDVLHSWAMPALGVKMDAVPGRLNETWFRVEQPGMYYGQCSELCGVNHGFMPITLKAVSKEEYAEWSGDAVKRYSRMDLPETSIAGLSTAEDGAN